MRSARFLATLMALGAPATLGCGGDADPPTDVGTPAAGSDAGGGTAPYDLEGCVVSVLATDCAGGLPVPHQVELLRASTGEPLPGFKTTSAAGGKYTFKNIPGDIEIAVHAIGVGPASEGGSTYDSIAFHARESGDNLLRVSSVGTAGLAGMAAGFQPAMDRVAVSGAVYQVDDGGRRVGTIGCAQIYLDDEPHPATRVDQRYNAANGIPTTLGKLDQTLAGSGRFYIANLDTGEHTLKVTLDQGRSFIAERKLFIGRTRAQAESPFKALLYLVGIDVKGVNPTPAGCPTEEKM